MHVVRFINIKDLFKESIFRVLFLTFSFPNRFLGTKSIKHLTNELQFEKIKCISIPLTYFVGSGVSLS